VVAGSEAGPSRSAHRFDRQMSVRRTASQNLISFSGSRTSSQTPGSDVHRLASCALPWGSFPVMQPPDCRLNRRAGVNRLRRRSHRDPRSAHGIVVKVVVAVTPCSVAVMMVVPVLQVAKATPFWPITLLIVATLWSDEDQLTELVRNRCVPSL